MSALLDAIERLTPAEDHTDYTLSRMGARSFIGTLKDPANARRDLTLVPDIDIRLILPKGPALPGFIVEHISRVPDRDNYTARSLLGLCLNGLGPNPQLFLNVPRMREVDPSGLLIDEVAWHEYIHGAEGIENENGVRGAFTRAQPWSYQLQNAMLDIDLKLNHVVTPKTLLNRSYGDTRAAHHLFYLRRGTALQENASEIFARLGAVFFHRIVDTGHALGDRDSRKIKRPVFSESCRQPSRLDTNLRELFLGVSTYSPPAQTVFHRHLPEAIRRIRILYGCAPG